MASSGREWERHDLRPVQKNMRFFRLNFLGPHDMLSSSSISALTIESPVPTALLSNWELGNTTLYVETPMGVMSTEKRPDLKLRELCMLGVRLKKGIVVWRRKSKSEGKALVMGSSELLATSTKGHFIRLRRVSQTSKIIKMVMITINLDRRHNSFSHSEPGSPA